jgi:8-oxo-dGTP diphosphatase
MAINTIPDIHQLVLCANIYVVKDNKVLMMRRSLQKTYLPGFLQPIGGKVDLDEDPLSAAKRELMEEASIQVTNLKLKGIVTEIKSKKDSHYQTNWQIFHFVAQYDGDDVGTTEEGELVWLTLDELKQEKLSDSIRAIIDQLLDKSSNIVFAKYTYGENNTLIEKDIQVL